MCPLIQGALTHLLGKMTPSAYVFSLQAIHPFNVRGNELHRNQGLSESPSLGQSLTLNLKLSREHLLSLPYTSEIIAVSYDKAGEDSHLPLLCSLSASVLWCMAEENKILKYRKKKEKEKNIHKERTQEKNGSVIAKTKNRIHLDTAIKQVLQTST